MVDWHNIETLLLDMDGTLLDLQFDNQFWLHHLPRRFAEAHQLNENEARDQLYARFEALQGTLNWYCIDYWNEALKLDLPALKQELKHLIDYRPSAREFLAAAREHHCQVVLVTNAHRKSLNLKLAETDLGDWLDVVVSSHDFGHPKEDQAFWHKLQEHTPFDPATSLFIDDSETVLRSARQFGIRYLLTITQPDSARPARAQLQFPAIDSFLNILPGPASKS